MADEREDDQAPANGWVDGIFFADRPGYRLSVVKLCPIEAGSEAPPVHVTLTREEAHAMAEAGYMSTAEYVRLFGEDQPARRSPGQPGETE